MLEVGFDPGGGFAPHPGDPGSGRAGRQSSGNAANGDRAGRRDALERAKASASLSLDRSAPDS